MAKFNVGDRVEVTDEGRRYLAMSLRASMSGYGRILGRVTGFAAYLPVVNFDDERIAHPYDRVWVMLPSQIVLTDEDASDAEIPRSFKVGDRVEIIGDSRTGIVESVDDHDSDVRLVGRIIARTSEYCDVLLDDERYRSDYDNQAWLIRVEELRPVTSDDANDRVYVEWPTPQKGGNDPKRINVETTFGKSFDEIRRDDPTRINLVLVDVDNAIVGDDRPSAPSQAFKDAMCAMLIGGYDKHRDSFVKDEPIEENAIKMREALKKRSTRKRTKKDASA